jgi:RNA-directed DNA polymerase
LHPNKIYLQHYGKGVKFLGSVIKPHRIYIGSRTKGNLHEVITEMNKIDINSITKELIKQYVARLNSYLGNMTQYKTMRLRKKLLVDVMDKRWREYILIASPYEKVCFIKTSLTKSPNQDEKNRYEHNKDDRNFSKYAL